MVKAWLSSKGAAVTPISAKGAFFPCHLKSSFICIYLRGSCVYMYISLLHYPLLTNGDDVAVETGKVFPCYSYSED